MQYKTSNDMLSNTLAPAVANSQPASSQTAAAQPAAPDFPVKDAAARRGQHSGPNTRFEASEYPCRRECEHLLWRLSQVFTSAPFINYSLLRHCLFASEVLLTKGHIPKIVIVMHMAA